MYLNANRNPAWYRDAKWLSALLLIIVLAATILAISLTQVTRRERALPLLQNALSLTLLPGGLDEAARLAELQSALQLEPGQPFEIISGIEVLAQPEALADLSAAAGRQRVASVLTERLLRVGLAGMLELVNNETLRPQLSEAVTGALQALVQARLELSLLPSGLNDGSRLADWRLQLQRNPGETVQPIVGVFVEVDPDLLQGLSEREIGVLIVERLADIVVGQGLGAAQELVTNSNLAARLTSTVQTELPVMVQSFFAALLMPQQEAIAERLQRLREVQARGTDEKLALIEGVEVFAEARALEQLSPSEANQRVIAELAQVMYASGLGGMLELVPDPELSARLERSLSPLTLFSAPGHRSLLTWSWLLGAATLILTVLLLFFSSGLFRFLVLGLALLFAALPGTLGFGWLYRWLQTGPNTTLPADLASEGALAHLYDLLAHLGSSIPTELARMLARNHLAVLALGAVLILLYLLINLVRMFRPRRSRF